MKVPPMKGARCEKRSTISVEGVIGYPEENLAPAAIAPSHAAWSPSMKCEPVSTPIGSAVVVGIVCLLGVFGLGRGLGQAISVYGKVRAEHPAEIATRTFFRFYGV